ncbi:MAG: NADH-quinone oxidoreductase subunit C [Tenuifilum sp.]|uniref:hydrogenase large subunit n=1 Tax=Tenuifilum sp. TaxID=2760880 RepID=UPI001B47CA69|nr:NADH-quinone oxidoreductase subunit C [Bacteroidales bacterium]HOK61222.1 NADH-quinone oxidoreductase subunit C [Tenuifilum sp.]MBP9029054.1 NADH-quinone oxidoreductase subunit C [Bacteroidales bacterium]HOK85254.1 NADH-quinone oxidoreductase subunit C [Tenuifilum sp.]HON70684.1 NADH-quinone oxidoreductase subunit C [Tenuifilum sp.]
MNYISIKNNQTIPVADIPVLDYQQFSETNISLLSKHADRHCVNYFGYIQGNSIKLVSCIADDTSHEIYISSCLVDSSKKLESMSSRLLCFEKFEREIHENFGVVFENHPWMKPVRYPYNRADKSSVMDNYPFYSIDSEELHEVGVGPIHAGIIEPGHFRFICNGEQILHLEIQLGYQHRGLENLFLQKKKLLQRVTLAESIAGDTVAGHTTAFCYLWESLSGFDPKPEIDFYRTLALELERIAIHTGDLSAICTDIAYQLGSSVFGRLRTPIINFIQEWGGNRLSKGLIRPGKTQFPFTKELGDRLNEILNDYEPDFNEMCKELFKLPSALSRLERTGTVSYDDVLNIGAVGMSARMSGLLRDIRTTHPYALYPQLNHKPILKHHGDVYSRAQIRREEIWQSMAYIRQLLKDIPESKANYEMPIKLKPNAFSISLVEGWRGEICHCAITDADGDLAVYKVKDPSFHNWLALALAVRNNEISDFPICNKSFNLSYCGHDL